MSPDSFLCSDGPSLGVELELQLVDARSMALTGAIDAILADVPAGFQDAIQQEFYDCCVEINTGVCRDVDEVERDLEASLAVTGRIAGRHGVLLAWGGTHPFSHWREQPVVPTPRYRELADLYRETLCRQLTFGFHVHVGVEDGDAAVRVCNRIGEHLPVLLALSANSPFWCGRATGLQAHRVEVMGASPTGGLPPRLDGWGDYARLVERITAAGLIQTPKELWWDVRPSPDHGTVEVRMCDMPADLPTVLGLTALTQCLVVELARERDDRPELDECGLMIVRQNRWRAARFGLDAGLIDPRSGQSSPAREVARSLVDRFRGLAEALGCARQLDSLRRMADGPTGAERQLAAYEGTGDLAAVVRSMTAGSVPGAVQPATTPLDRADLHIGGSCVAACSGPGTAIAMGARSPLAVG